MAGFGNDRYDGYQAKSYEYKPAWEKQVDYNPDHRRSDGAMFIESTDRGSFWVLQIKGPMGQHLGVMVMRASFDPDEAKLHFDGVSTFTESEIHTGAIDESYMTTGRTKGLVGKYAV